MKEMSDKEKEVYQTEAEDEPEPMEKRKKNMET